MPAEEIQSKLAGIFDRLRSVCRVWAGTLPPREADSPAIHAKRHAVNDWLRHRAQLADVIDFEAALTVATDPDHFRSGLGHDGIHPTIEGQRLMGIGTARVLSSPTLTSLSPERAPAERSATVTLYGTGFKAGASVPFGSSPASSLQFLSASELRATAPPSSPGKVDVRVTNRDGLSFALPQAFEYQATQPSNPESPPSERESAASSHGCSSTGRGATYPVIISIVLLVFFRAGAKGHAPRRN